MSCALCTRTNKSAKSLVNDCILESLDKIKAHYIHFKSQLDEKHREIGRLQSRNDELTRNLASLKCSPKRRKTNSSDDSPSLVERSVSDSLNEAIRADPSFDESFFIATQTTQPDAAVATPPNNVLKVCNKSSERDTPPSATYVVRGEGAGLLPPRLKVNTRNSKQPDVGRTSTGLENRSPRWSSKEDFKNAESKNSGLGVVKREWNMSFMHAPATFRSSPKTSPTDKKTLLSLKKEVNLKQTRLRFDNSRLEDQEETIVQETDETFCGDLVAASPTTVTSASHHETLKSRTGRKFNRPKFLSDTANKNQSAKSNNIKMEPPSQVKKTLRLLTTRPPPPSSFDEKQTKDPDSTSISGIEPHSDQSVCILPSQEPDIIFVEDSNANVNVNIDSDTLFDAMMVKSDETSDFLRQIEEKCIQNVRNEQDKQNEIGKTSSGNTSPGVLSTVNQRKSILSSMSRTKLNSTKQSKELDTSTIDPCNKPTKNIPKWNCKECESYYTVAGCNMEDHEILKRMKHCAENHRRSLCETPEGFWNPCFPATQEDDPRYITLIESKAVEKKKSSI